ncbi:MAG: 50S ribosomal protein L11 methyltransferase [Vulcanimicrobiota bacterium]
MKHESHLQEAMEALVPFAFLQWQAIPGTSLEGFLLNAPSASRPLDSQTADRVAEAPPFWGLLWPAGYLLCRLLAQQEELVRGRACVDLGCGSGLLAAAVARAGGRVVAADCDPLSRSATRLHLQRQGVSAEVCPEWQGRTETLFLADLLYHDSNLEILEEVRARADEIVIVDCRLEELAMEGFEFFGRRRECAFPDLDPHREFGAVSLWYAGSRRGLWSEALQGLESPFEG